MMVPRAKLLAWVAIVVLPFSILGGVEPAVATIAALAIGAFLVMVIVDAIRGRNSLAGVGVSLPPIIRLSRDRAGRFEVRIHNASQQPRQLRLALPLPREFHSAHEDIELSLPGQAEWSRLAWECRPLRRGRFQLHTAGVEAASPMGFWSMRRRVPAPAEVRVYPNLLTERKNLAALFLNRGAFGIHARRQIGKGRDFEKLREYVAGDDYHEIHWKATARRGRPVTKVFQIERTQEIYVIIDASRLSARTQIIPPSAAPNAPPTDPSAPQAETTVLERFVTAALVLGLAAEQQGDLFGLLTFADKVGTFVRARNGSAHYGACRDALYTLQPAIVTPDFDDVATFLRLRLRRRALLIFLTSLDDPVLAASFVANLDLLCRQHLVLVNMIQPPGVVPLFTSPDVRTTDDLYRQLGGHLLWHKLRELEKVFKRRGAGFALLDQERLSAQLVTQYLNVKQRQLL